MNLTKLSLLKCPVCRSQLQMGAVRSGSKDLVEEGDIVCSVCKRNYPVVRHIPRFCHPDNYANSFGFEWNTHPLTQYDEFTGVKLSEERFFDTTKWERNLVGQRVLEVGCGAGRHTQPASMTGAELVCMDLSNAVEANYKMNGIKDNVLIAQADVYAMPFEPGTFDKVFCLGVIQHTPDPRKAFLAMVNVLKPGGKIAIDVYRNRWYFYLAPKKWLRAFTKHMPPEKLYILCKKWVNFMWPVASWVRKIPGGRMFNRGVLLVADYGGFYSLPENHLKEWAILDTFDALSPMYEKRQSVAAFRRWFEEAGLKEIDVVEIVNDCVHGRGTKPAK